MLLSLCLLFYALVGTNVLVVASSHHGHSHAAHLHSHGHVKRNESTSNVDGIEAARQLLAKGQAAMARANRAIVSDPRPNRMEVLDAAELKEARVPPPPLDYNENNNGSALLMSRSNVNGTSGNQTLEAPRYTVPDELITAARLVSEAWKPSIDDGEYAEAVASLQDRYKDKVDDTQMMPPMLQHASGLTEYVDEPAISFRYGENVTDVVDTPKRADSASSLQKRNANNWWMSSIRQRGSSPFSPDGYEVC